MRWQVLKGYSSVVHLSPIHQVDNKALHRRKRLALTSTAWRTNSETLQVFDNFKPVAVGKEVFPA
jgi:hypothetical protein